jgi:hypothetical protein
MPGLPFFRPVSDEQRRRSRGKLAVARDYTSELLPNAESFNFCEEYRSGLRITLIAIQGMLKATFPAGANVIGLVVEFLDRACAQE